ncbi:unnamed protein product [Pieris brassicae]|uniref:Uncharacterized protein n=1 Tax=Pieris brassicae TaxID=7116 RepID=A0A9P0TSI6_PIEBR|nr:unnamed protein product [Pieris brassicae]
MAVQGRQSRHLSRGGLAQLDPLRAAAGKRLDSSTITYFGVATRVASELNGPRPCRCARAAKRERTTKFGNYGLVNLKVSLTRINKCVRDRKDVSPLSQNRIESSV